MLSETGGTPAGARVAPSVSMEPPVEEKIFPQDADDGDDEATQVVAGQQPQQKQEVIQTAPEPMVFKKSDLQLKRKEELLKIAGMYGLLFDGKVKRQEVINSIVAEQEKVSQPATA